MPHTGSAPISPDALFDIDALLDDEEREIRHAVRALVQRRVAPHITAWYEAGELPVRELARDLGGLGLLAVHAYGSDDLKNDWLPAMATGRAIGCFGLTEPLLFVCEDNGIGISTKTPTGWISANFDNAPGSSTSPRMALTCPRPMPPPETRSTGCASTANRRSCICAPYD